MQGNVYAFPITIVSILLLGMWLFFQLDANIALFLAELYVQGKPSLLSKSFHNKTVLIAGASDGIGAEMARQLSSKTNSKLVLMARTKSKLEKVQNECERLAKQSLSGASISILLGDVTKGEEAMSSLMKKTLIDCKTDHFDILIMSAGRAYERTIEKTDMELIRSTFELNVMGAISTVKAFLSHTSSKDSKQIILISSLVGKMPTALCAGYSASKAAVNLFFDTLRAERADVRVTTVCPGPVATNIFAASAQAMGEALDNDTIKAMEGMMSVERAVTLMLAGCVALPVCLFFELWICPQPLLLFTYMNQFCPGLIKHFASARMKNRRKW